MAIPSLSHDQFMEHLSKAVRKESVEKTRKDGSRRVYTRCVVDDNAAFDKLKDGIAAYMDARYQHEKNQSYAAKFIHKMAVFIISLYEQFDYQNHLDEYITEIFLVNDIKNPNQEAYNLLYSKFINRVRAFYNIKTRNVQDGTDLAEVAFGAAYENIEKYDPQYGFYQFITNYLGKSILNKYWKTGLTTIFTSQISAQEFEDGLEWEDIPLPVKSGVVFETPEIAVILLRLVFLCGKPHAVISFSFKKLFDCDSKDFVDKSLGSVVGDLAEEVCSNCHEFIDPFMPEDFFYNNVSKFFLLKIDLPVRSIYNQKRYESWWSRQIRDLVYDVFYTDRDKFKQVDDWNSKLAERIKEQVKKDRPCEDDSINVEIARMGGKVPGMKHLDLETIRHYGAKMMSEQEAAAVDEHLAGCQECVNRVWAHQYIHDHFDQVWEEFTSGRLFKESLADQRMTSPDGEPLAPELKARTKALMADLKGRAVAVLKVVMDVKRKTAQVFDEGLELLGHAREALSFSPAVTPVRVLGEEKVAGTVLEAQGPPWTQVIVDPVAQRIAIRMEIIDPPWPIAVIHAKENDTRVIAEFHQPEGTDYVLVEVEDLPSGEFSVTLERSGSHEKTNP